MFHLFRSRKQAFRIMLGVIVAPVILTMVITLIPGIGATSGGDSDTVLAEVNGDPITLRQTQTEFQDYVEQRKVPAGAYGFLAPKIVQDLIAERAMLVEAERFGLGVTEAELADLLRTSMPFLFQGGGFIGKDQYAAFIQERFRKTIPQFEALIRKDLAINTKLRKLVTDGVVVRPEEVDREFRRRNEKVRIEYAAVSNASVLASVSSSQAEIAEYFQKNRPSYSLPERRSLHYMVIDDSRVAPKVQVTAQELERYYNQNRERYRVQDRARLTHILLKTAEKKDDDNKKVEAKAQDLLSQVRAGKDFAELAKTNSEDSVSAAKGGEIGWVTRGQTVPEFEQKAFSMKAGEISDLVKTQYGYHILKMLERETARMKTFAEVEPDIRKELSRERTEQERARLADRARAAAGKYAPKLEEAAREVGLEALSARLIERGAPLPDAGADPALMDALFSAAKNSVIGPVHAGPRSVIAVVTEIAPARQAELADVAGKVQSDCNNAKARLAAEARAKEAVDKAKAAGGDLKKAAREFRIETKSSEPITREGSIPNVGPASSLAAAFTAPVGAVLGPVAAGDGQVIYKVLEHIEPDQSQSADEKKIIRDQMLGNRQNEAFEIYKEELTERLKKQGKIKIYQERVDRFVKNSRS